MGWSIDDIEKRFLDGKIEALALAPEIILSTFERVESLLGPSWIDSATGKGSAPTLHIIGMGLRLACLEGIEGSEKLVESIRHNDRDSEAELTAIYLIRSSRPSAKIQLYPEILNRKADFRVRDDTEEQWTTVEVTRPNASREHNRVQSILKRLAEVLTKSEHQFTLDVLFRREPTQAEIGILCDHLPQFCKLEGKHQAELTNDLGTLLLNKTPLGRVVKWTFVDSGDAPIIGLARIVSRACAPHQQLSVSLPFSDERAEEILKDEARQLPERGIGFIMIDVGRVIGSFQDWEAIFRRRFQPKQHTRVSGVCLFEGITGPTVSGYDWL